MKILVQWTRRNPRDWIEVDSSAWASLPKRSEPQTGEMGGQNNVEGWLFDVNVQGVLFGGNDHVAVEDIPGGCRVYSWSDDPDDDPEGEWFGSVWEFLDPAPDPVHGGKVNTRQRVVRYANNPEKYPGVAILPFSEFPKPAESITRHGVWLRQQDVDLHMARRSLHGWKEWIA